MEGLMLVDGHCWLSLGSTPKQTLLSNSDWPGQKSLAKWSHMNTFSIWKVRVQVPSKVFHMHHWLVRVRAKLVSGADRMSWSHWVKGVVRRSTSQASVRKQLHLNIGILQINFTFDLRSQEYTAWQLEKGQNRISDGNVDNQYWWWYQ